jgi:ubiquinone/menaquinone biosynthesis C-methylase UbiE
MENTLNACDSQAQGTSYANVEFYWVAIDRLPLADASIDCVVGNCVINLASDQPAVLREVARVLNLGESWICFNLAQAGPRYLPSRGR